MTTATTHGGRRVQAAIVALTAALSIVGLASEASATHQPSCGETITHNVILNADVGPCTGDGLIIGADNITVDLNGHTIGGLPGVPQIDGTGAGVLIEDRTGVTVKNGTVKDFDGGVVIVRGVLDPADPASGNYVGSHSVTGLEVTANVGTLTTQWGEGIGLWESDGNTVEGNVVSLNGPYAGIGLYGNLSNNGSDDNIVRNNQVDANLAGPTEVIGIRLEPYAKRNKVDYNTVTGSRLDGIAVFFGSTHNELTGNDVTASGRNGIRLWHNTSDNVVSLNVALNNVREDLYDHSGACVANRWFDNTYGTKSPDCID